MLRKIAVGIFALLVSMAMPAHAQTGRRLLLLSGRGQLWTPLSLGSNLLEWWDSKNQATFSFTSGNVASWTDVKSGKVASQATPANQPGYSNGLLSCTASLQVLGVSGMPTAYDVATVGTPLAAGSFRTLFWAAASFNIALLLNTNTNVGLYQGSFKQADSLIWPAQVGLFYQSVVDATTISMGRDGVTPLSTVATANLTSRAIAAICNSSPTGGQPWGTFGDIIVTLPGQSLSNQNKINGFLAWKFNAQSVLPATSPYKNRPPYVTDP